MGKIQAVSSSRRRDKWTGLAIIGAAFLGCMGLSIWGMQMSTPRTAPAPLPVSQEDLPGFPNAVEPFALLARARALSVRDKLRGLTLQGVRADGTVDLEDAGSSVLFAFQSESGMGPQPVREPGTLPPRRYCGVQHVWVDQRGIVARPDNAAQPCGGKPILDLGAPRHCSLVDLWKVAKKKGFSTKSPAHVEYFSSDGGPAYRITQKKRKLTLSTRDCSTELKGRATHGNVP